MKRLRAVDRNYFFTRPSTAGIIMLFLYGALQKKEAFQMLHLLARNENHQFMKERDLSAVRFVMLSQILELKAVVEPDFNIKVFSKTS